MIRRPPRSTPSNSSAASDVYKRQGNKLIPTVPSNQGFYQLLWDNPDRSNRSLKRTAPQAKKSSTLFSPPEAKKSKTSDDTRAACPQTSPLLRSSPKSFEDASRKVQEAWKGTFPSLRFPVEMIVLFPTTKSPLVAVPHEIPPVSTHQPTTHSSKLKVAINKNLESQFLKERAFFAG